jgi:hypothetical protein
MSSVRYRELTKEPFGRKDFLPVEPWGGSLLPLSPKRTQVRLKSLLHLVWLTPDSLRAHGHPLDKSTVYGLNGQRSYCVIALSLATYGHAIWKSRSFTALFSWTRAPEVS